MTGRFFKKKDSDPSLTMLPEDADQLLSSILNKLDIKDRHIAGKRRYYYHVLRRHILKGTAIVCGVLILGILAPGTVIPAPISSVSAAPSTDASSVQVSFHISSIIPVKSISASLNETSVPVQENGFQNYSVNVEENGYLLLDVYSSTGMHSSHGMHIDSIDGQAPRITRHFASEGSIYIYISDGSGTGVDFPAIRSYNTETGYYSAPLYYDKERGYAVFPYPESQTYITIPDKKGNSLTALLSPVIQNN